MPLETIYFYSAVVGIVVLLTQLGMMLLGGDDGFEGDAGGIDTEGSDTDSSGFWFFEIISIRTLAAAVSFFGLVGGAVNSMGQPPGVSIVLGCVAGYGAMYAVYWAFKQLFGMESDGNLNIENAIGLPAEVYVPIGPSNSQAGKVHVYLQGRTAEYQALTDSDQTLATGTKVTITQVVSSDTLRVTPTAS